MATRLTVAKKKGAVNGVATLGADQKAPAAQLPSYVDDVIEIATKAALPGVGESGKIYLVLADESRNDATEQYRWSGSVFTRIPTSPGSTDEVTEGATRLYFTENRVRAAILTGLSLATNAAITDDQIDEFCETLRSQNSKGTFWLLH